MKRMILAGLLMLAVTGASSWGADGVAPAAPAAAKEAALDLPIEVCFVLDTTGSMGGLIAGAKQKIWSIANSIVKENPKSRLRIALVPYRDRGDEYVTKVIDLTDDLDAMYTQLMAFKADGGGDSPESVNKALNDAVEKVSWGNGGKEQSIRIVFLVGDCPPHMDYQDDVKYPATLESAVAKKIIVDTIQCGQNAETTRFWQEIARMGKGDFLQIAQTGGVVAISTPQDKKLAELSGQLGQTVIPYGNAAQQKAVQDKNAMNGAPASESGAARIVYNNSGAAGRGGGGGFGGGGGAAVGGRGDLTNDILANKDLLTSLKAEELPENLQKMTPEERSAYIDKQIAQRKAINDEIAKVAKEREAYIKQEMEKNGAAKDGFDLQVTKTIQSNAAAAREQQKKN